MDRPFFGQLLVRDRHARLLAEAANERLARWGRRPGDSRPAVLGEPRGRLYRPEREQACCPATAQWWATPVLTAGAPAAAGCLPESGQTAASAGLPTANREARPQGASRT